MDGLYFLLRKHAVFSFLRVGECMQETATLAIPGRRVTWSGAWSTWRTNQWFSPWMESSSSPARAPSFASLTLRQRMVRSILLNFNLKLSYSRCLHFLTVFTVSKRKMPEAAQCSWCCNLMKSLCDISSVDEPLFRNRQSLSEIKLK